MRRVLIKNSKNIYSRFNTKFPEKYEENDMYFVGTKDECDFLMFKQKHKDRIKIEKKMNQEEDFPWDGNVFLGGKEKLRDYEGSLRLGIAVGKTEGDIFDKNDKPVHFDTDGATAFVATLGSKIWICKENETKLFAEIDSATTIEEVEAVVWEHVR